MTTKIFANNETTAVHKPTSISYKPKPNDSNQYYFCLSAYKYFL